jgi:eukaryotic-like serine/threonine-protein kinase
VTGLARDSAEQLLTDAGLEPAIVETESEKPEGDVISQNPAAGTEVDKGSRVTVTVSKGIPMVSVPDVTGRSRRDAVAQLRAVGLVPSVREQDVTDPAQDAVVIDERPGAGTQLAKGKQVVIVVGALISGDQLQNPGDQGSSP